MRVAVVQSGNSGFFPRFYQDFSEVLGRDGHDIMLFLPNSGRNRRSSSNRAILWGYRWNWFVHFNLYKWTGIQDIWSLFSTIDLCEKLKKYNPDIIHLNVINEQILCFPYFVKFLNKLGVPIIWTFHDTRTITARCASFEEDQCYQWQSGCRKCTPNAIFNPSIVNNVHLQWKLKKNWFNNINNLTIVTPSQWLANHVKNSYLKDKPCIVIHNGIDTSSFSVPLEIKISALEGIKSKILLSVAVEWTNRKGLDSMIWLSKNLPEGYQIVLVGGVKPELADSIPSNIICLPRTNSKEELIAIYQRADVYVNPTLADNFPTVNIEALGAGLPVVTFNTGGSAESLDDTCGISVEKGNNQALMDAIIYVCSHPEKYTKENCIKRSQMFGLSQFGEYLNLYQRIIAERYAKRFRN